MIVRHDVNKAIHRYRTNSISDISYLIALSPDEWDDNLLIEIIKKYAAISAKNELFYLLSLKNRERIIPKIISSIYFFIAEHLPQQLPQFVATVFSKGFHFNLALLTQPEEKVVSTINKIDINDLCDQLAETIGTYPNECCGLVKAIEKLSPAGLKALLEKLKSAPDARLPHILSLLKDIDNPKQLFLTVINLGLHHPAENIRLFVDVFGFKILKNINHQKVSEKLNKLLKENENSRNAIFQFFDKIDKDKTILPNSDLRNWAEAQAKRFFGEKPDAEPASNMKFGNRY